MQRPLMLDMQVIEGSYSSLKGWGRVKPRSMGVVLISFWFSAVFWARPV
jgi:hypothetical protein